MVVGRPVADVGEGVEVLGADTEQVDSVFVDEVPQAGWPGMHDVAVDGDDRDARRERRRQPVPHHPPARGDVEQTVARRQIGVELVLLEVGQQHPSGAVDDALGSAGRAAGVQDVPRVVEAAAGERGGCAAVRGEEGVPVGPEGDGALHARQAGDDLVLHGAAVVAGPAVVVAVDGEQDRGLDLAEPVEDAVGAEVGAGRGEHRADGHGTEHRHHGLDPVGQPRRDPIALGHPDGRQGAGHRADLGREAVPADGPGAVLVDRDDGRAVPGVLEEVLHDAERCVGEEPGLSHRGAGLEDPVAGLADDTTRLPHRPPEHLGLGDRPTVQRLVAVVAGAGHERGHAGDGHTFRRGGPQRRRRHGASIIGAGMWVAPPMRGRSTSGISTDPSA